MTVEVSAGAVTVLSPHSLRHAAITNALDAGVPLRGAQILARHADPRTTEMCGDWLASARPGQRAEHLGLRS